MWKPPSKETVVQGNVMPGSIYCTGTAGFKEADRVVFRNNLLGGTPNWEGEPFGTWRRRRRLGRAGQGLCQQLRRAVRFAGVPGSAFCRSGV